MIEISFSHWKEETTRMTDKFLWPVSEGTRILMNRCDGLFWKSTPSCGKHDTVVSENESFNRRDHKVCYSWKTMVVIGACLFLAWFFISASSSMWANNQLKKAAVKCCHSNKWKQWNETKNWSSIVLLQLCHRLCSLLTTLQNRWPLFGCFSDQNQPTRLTHFSNCTLKHCQQSTVKCTNKHLVLSQWKDEHKHLLFPPPDASNTSKCSNHIERNIFNKAPCIKDAGCSLTLHRFAKLLTRCLAKGGLCLTSTNLEPIQSMHRK